MPYSKIHSSSVPQKSANVAQRRHSRIRPSPRRRNSSSPKFTYTYTYIHRAYNIVYVLTLKNNVKTEKIVNRKQKRKIFA